MTMIMVVAVVGECLLDLYVRVCGNTSSVQYATVIRCSSK